MQIGGFNSRTSARSTWKLTKSNRFSGEKWSPTADGCASAFLLVEIAISGPGGVSVPEFVSRMIEDGRSPDPQSRRLFVDIVERLKESRFEIVAGVDSEDVSAFVARVESAEQSGNWE
jgi:hypothetical protein